MTLDEAIVLQKELKRLLPEVGFNKYLASNELGIEALKRQKREKDEIPSELYLPLPGETEE